MARTPGLDLWDRRQVNRRKLDDRGQPASSRWPERRKLEAEVGPAWDYRIGHGQING